MLVAEVRSNSDDRRETTHRRDRHDAATDDQVAHAAAQRVDAGVPMACRMHAVGQQRPGESTSEIDPHAGAGEAGMTDRLVRTGVAAGPSLMSRFPTQASRRRLPRAHLGQPWLDALQQALRRIEDAVDRAEQPGMAGGAAQREGILVVHLAAHHAAAPGAAFGRRGLGRVRTPGQCRRQRQVAERQSGQPLDGDAEQHEIDVGINRRPVLPDPLQDEGAQRRRVQTIGVERLDRGQVGLMAQALAERQAALRRVAIVLPQVGNCHGQCCRPARCGPAPRDAGLSAW